MAEENVITVTEDEQNGILRSIIAFTGYHWKPIITVIVLLASFGAYWYFSTGDDISAVTGTNATGNATGTNATGNATGTNATGIVKKFLNLNDNGNACIIVDNNGVNEEKCFDSLNDLIIFISEVTNDTNSEFFISKTEAESRYLPITEAENFMSKTEAESRYLLITDAKKNYFPLETAKKVLLTENGKLDGKFIKLRAHLKKNYFSIKAARILLPTEGRSINGKFLNINNEINNKIKKALKKLPSTEKFVTKKMLNKAQVSWSGEIKFNKDENDPGRE
jgi:hypothetical protein